MEEEEEQEEEKGREEGMKPNTNIPDEHRLKYTIKYFKQISKRLYIKTKLALSLECRDGSTYTNQ